MAASSIKFGDYDTGVVPALPVAAGDGQPFGLSATHPGVPPGTLSNPSFEHPLAPLPAGGWQPYDDPALGLPNVFDIFEQSTDWASDGSRSLHFKTANGSEFQPIDPGTYDGTGVRPSGWWPVTAGDALAWRVDGLGVHQADYIADALGVFLEIDFYDASLALVDGARTPHGAQDVHLLDGTPVDGMNVALVNPWPFGVEPSHGSAMSWDVPRVTVPAGAVWAVPYVGSIYDGSGGGDYVEAYIDNAFFGRTDTAVYAASGLPGGLSIDTITGTITGTITEVAGHSGTTTVTLTLGSRQVGEISFTWHIP